MSINDSQQEYYNLQLSDNKLSPMIKNILKNNGIFKKKTKNKLEYTNKNNSDIKLTIAKKKHSFTKIQENVALSSLSFPSNINITDELVNLENLKILSLEMPGENNICNHNNKQYNTITKPDTCKTTYENTQSSTVTYVSILITKTSKKTSAKPSVKPTSEYIYIDEYDPTTITQKAIVISKYRKWNNIIVNIIPLKNFKVCPDIKHKSIDVSKSWRLSKCEGNMKSNNVIIDNDFRDYEYNINNNY